MPATQYRRLICSPSLPGLWRWDSVDIQLAGILRLLGMIPRCPQGPDDVAAEDVLDGLDEDSQVS